MGGLDSRLIVTVMLLALGVVVWLLADRHRKDRDG